MDRSYKVIEERNKDRFEKKVAECRAKGWIYVGGITVTSWTGASTKTYYQGMENPSKLKKTNSY